MNESREASQRRFERALEVYLAHAESGEVDAERLLRSHADLSDLLRPMLDAAAGDTGADDTGAGETDAPEATAQVLGDFRLVRELGRGGMGIVYEAWQRSLDRRVALKVLAPALVANPGSVARFRREAAAVARLRHPGIVEVHGFGSDDERHWFAMEFVDGEPLHRCADRFRDPRAAVTIVAQLLDALQHAHAAGLVHRDVKPANILVRADGSAVLTDFGLAADSELPSMTAEGSFLGTLDYASPEQVQGQPIDARTDVWSAGLVLYELLTKVRPFSKPTPAATLRSILGDEPGDVRMHAPAVSADHAAVVARALEKDPRRRYPSAVAMLADLRALQADAPVSARHPTAHERVVRWARREPWRAVAAAVALLAVPALAGALGYLAANAPKIASAEAAEAQRQREEVLAQAFLLTYEEDPSAALRELDRLPATVFGQDVEATVLRGHCLDLLDREDDAAALLAKLPAGSISEQVRAWVLGKPIQMADAAARDPLDDLVLGIELARRGKRDEDAAAARSAAAHFARASLAFGKPRTPVLVMWMQAANSAGDRSTVTTLIDALDRHFPASRGVAIARAHVLTTADPETALPLLESFAAQPPPDAATLFNIALAHEKLRRFAEAEAGYRRCLEVNPEHARAWNNLGMMLRRKEDHTGAAEAFRAATAADPNHHRAWNNLGITLRALGDTAGARQALLRAIAVRPDYAIAHSNLGNLLLAADDTDGAMREFRAAIAADPRYVPPRANLGNALRKVGKKQEALLEYVRAADTAPGDVIPAYNVARTALELGLHDLARSSAERACALAPKRRDVHELLEQVLAAATPPDDAALEAVRKKLADWK